MLLGEGAALVVPLQHHVLAAVLSQGLGLAARVGGGEAWSGRAYAGFLRRGLEAHERGQQGRATGERKPEFHDSQPPEGNSDDQLDWAHFSFDAEALGCVAGLGRFDNASITIPGVSTSGRSRGLVSPGT